MAENNGSLPEFCNDSIREAVCVHTSKIFDSCKDKDCIEDLRVYPTCSSQEILDTACSIRPQTAKLLYADIKVEEISFNRGCYTVDVTYFYKVTGEAFPCQKTVTGLAIFEKRVILYGSEGNAKVFSSRNQRAACMDTRSMPVAVVEAVDPLPLSLKIVDSSCACGYDCEVKCIPEEIANCFNDEIITSPTRKQLYVTLGQFSIIRLERDTQLLVPIYDYCIPSKECAGGVEDDPCTVFSNIPFPVNDFFPPNGDSSKCVVGDCTAAAAAATATSTAAAAEN